MIVASLASGDRLGPYEILRLIGRGGMGEVYLGRDTTLNREVALKVLPDRHRLDARRLARFDREARILASLNHPNIATLHGRETSSDTQALVMEFVNGDTLAECLCAEPLPLDRSLRIARQIVDALDAAHAHGIVHRDLKPDNIKVRPDGTVKVLDFGLAKATATSGAPRSLVTTSLFAHGSRFIADHTSTPFRTTPHPDGCIAIATAFTARRSGVEWWACASPK